MKKRRNDLLLLAAVVALATLLWLTLRVTRSTGAYVLVSVNGAQIGMYPLDEDLAPRIGDDTKYNILVIKDGWAQISEASCPDKLCVHQGKVRYDGQSLICLPNKVVVEIVGGEQSDYDAVAK